MLMAAAGALAEPHTEQETVGLWGKGGCLGVLFGGLDKFWACVLGNNGEFALQAMPDRRCRRSLEPGPKVPWLVLKEELHPPK